MKLALSFLLLFFSLIVISQNDDEIKTNGLFYKISLATTLTINEDYTFLNDEDETFIDPNAIFFNNTLGYQFDKRSSIGLNLEYNYYIKQDLYFFPAYLGFSYNIFDFDDIVFIRGGYGRLLNINDSFEKGTMYKLGLGYRTFDANFKNSWLIGLDFSRKRFGFRQTEKISSVSIFLEFILF